MADFPGSIKNFDSKTDDVDTCRGSDFKEIYDEVEAIQTELGTDPAGTETDVDDRLTTIEGDITTNAADIATNVTDISTNVTDIAALEAIIEENTEESIADDAVYSWTPGETTGLVMVSMKSSGTPRYGGIFSYRADTDPFMEDLGSSNINTTTGALAGTTGDDADCTISAHTDNKIYFENRAGATRIWGFVVIPLASS